MKNIKNLYILRLEIIEKLKNEETVTFFLEEDCEAETMLSVKKEKSNYVIKLGDEVLSNQDADELFYGFENMLKVNRLQDIPVYKIGGLN